MFSFLPLQQKCIQMEIVFLGDIDQMIAWTSVSAYKLDEYTDEPAWRQIGQSYLALVLVVAAFALADRGGDEK